MRLAGVGLLGVTHANSDKAIQRLVGKVELGLISQVLDTVINIEKGKVNEVLELKMVVRAPTGMESDLSRPVIEIKLFAGELTHEMFAFGSEIAVVPVSGGSGEGGSPAWRLAAEELKEASRLTGISVMHAKFLTDSSADIYVDDSAVGSMVGPGGDGIRQLEKDMGRIKLNVKSVTELPRALARRWEKARGAPAIWKIGVTAQDVSGNTLERSVKVEERVNADAAEIDKTHYEYVIRGYISRILWKQLQKQCSQPPQPQETGRL